MKRVGCPGFSGAQQPGPRNGAANVRGEIEPARAIETPPKAAHEQVEGLIADEYHHAAARSGTCQLRPDDALSCLGNVNKMIDGLGAACVTTALPGKIGIAGGKAFK